MHTIEIDFDVFKSLTMRRTMEEESYNDVLRSLLDLPPLKASVTNGRQSASEPWRVKGATFPDGTELRARYKGETHMAKVERGALVLKGKRFDSPSAAAVSITGANVNGWNFWQARLPGHSDWKVLAGFRS